MGKKKCVDFDKDISKDDVDIDLFHVTIDKDSVCKTGLKAHKDVPYCALGIGCQTDEFVSFSPNKEIADRILHDLKMKVMIANGIVTPENIKSVLESYDKIDGMSCSPSEAWDLATEKNYDEYRGKIWKNLKEGKVYNSKTYQFEKTDDQDKIQQHLFDLWRGEYLGKRQFRCKGMVNTGFDIDHKLVKLKNHDIKKLGIVKVKGSLPKNYKYYEESKSKDLGFEVGSNVDEQNNEIRLSPKRFNKLEIIE